MDSSDDLLTVIARFSSPHPAVWRPLDQGSGFSGATLWRITNPRADFLLRRWPENAQQQRLEAIHWLLFHIRFRSGLTFIPWPVQQRANSKAGNGFAWSVLHCGAVW